MTTETMPHAALNYEGLVEKSETLIKVDDMIRAQAEGMLLAAGLTIENKVGKVDRRVALYSLLRSDAKASHNQSHVGNLTDQRLLAEVLKMLGETEQLEKFKSTYANIFPKEK